MSIKIVGRFEFSRQTLERRRIQLALSLGVLAIGCASMSPNYGLTKSVNNLTPKAANCEFTVVTVPSDRPQEQVGILDAEMVPYAATTAAEFQDAVRKQVCEVGGDAVLAEINGRGRYVRGTIVRWKDDS
jgi:hypothetical protein